MTGKRQLSLKEVEMSKKLSNVRIHVECDRSSKKQIQNSTRYSPTSSDSDFANIDKILTVCAALTNNCPSVLPL